jgi:hypothetical protein
MRILLAKSLIVLTFLLLCVRAISAEHLEGRIGMSKDWGSGWIDLRATADFQRGDRLKIVVGGTAKKILLRFLPKGIDPNTPSGIDGGPRQVPSSRVIDVVLESDHRQVVQISVHGGPNPWNLIPLGEDNGPATLVSVERVSRQPIK